MLILQRLKHNGSNAKLRKAIQGPLYYRCMSVFSNTLQTSYLWLVV